MTRSVLALVSTLNFAMACAGSSVTLGLTEPIRVKDAQFIEGPLPGTPPRVTDGGAAPLENPRVLGELLNGRVVRAGQPGKDIGGGTATPDTVAVAAALDGAGSGYWLLPSGAPDPTNGGAVGWKMSIDFAESAPLGIQNLVFAAVDEAGRSGTQFVQPMCIVPVIQDWIGTNALEHNTCDPKLKPPAVVLSLDWDTPVDLDLEVATPEGVSVDAKHTTTALGGPDGGAAPDPSQIGRLIVDSNANCIPSGGNREQIVWEEQPTGGIYNAFVNLFDSCTKAGVHFNVALYVRQPGDEPGTWKQVETTRASGSLVAADANGGSRTGLFVLDFQVQ
jgi:hypothetical protein